MLDFVLYVWVGGACVAFFRAPFKRANQSARFPLANTTEPDLDLDGTFAPILKRNLYYELFINVFE